LILVDAGPLVAIMDADDEHHAKCTAAIQKARGPLATVWPALTEAMYHLGDLPAAQEKLLEMVDLGPLKLLPLEANDLSRIRELMRQYRDLPMDFADAALVRVAEREGIRTIFTVDHRDFSIYRLHGRIRPTLIP
jgi:uncharacterized protein